MVATRTSATSSRLPGGMEPGGSRGVEILKGLSALVVIALILVGVPLGLYSAYGAPWPDEMPSSDWVYTSFGPRQVLGVLVAVVWLAWLHFALCLVVEFVAERRGLGLSPRVPGGGSGTQPLARRLVAAVLLLAGGVAVAGPSASAATMADQHQPIAAVARTEPGAADHAHARQGIASAAEHGDKGSPAFTEETARGVTKYVEVQPPEGRNYDTLWGIAERYLGNGLRYKEIVELNRGMVQPDGTTLQNPDLIYPGWILRLPADADGPGLRVGDHPHPPAEADSHHGGPDGSPSADADSAAQAGSGSATPSAHRGSADEAGAAGADGASHGASMAAAGGFGAGGALLAAGLLLGLRRKRGWDRGPHPRGGRPLDHEFDLRTEADESSASFLDRVLRSLAESLPDEGSLPASTSCVLGADSLVLTFAAGSRLRLDAPWTGDAGGRTWTVRRADIPATASPSASMSLLPGLVPIGTSGAGSAETLLDVESAGGIVSLSGDLGIARDIAIAMGLGLATARWSDSPRVTFVGFADDLSNLAPTAVRHYDDLSGVLEALDGKRRRQHSACAANGYDSVRAGRTGDADPRLWAPEFVVLSGVPAGDDVNRLAALAADPRNAVGVIVVGDVPDAPVRMVASSQGRLWCGPLGIDVLAHRVTAEVYRDALSVFDAESARGGNGGPDGPDAPAGGMVAPIVDPDALDLTAMMPVEITSLGQVSVTGPGEVEERRRDLLTEIVVYLALHPEGIHPNVLAAAIWPRGVSDEVRDSAMAQAAGWLGVDAHGRARLGADGEGRWMLGRSGVRFDWDAFRALANRSVGGGSEALDDLESALGLVTGPAVTGLPAGRYGWLAYETVEADAGVAVVAVARRLAHLAAEAGDATAARAALAAGLRMAPACEQIWRDLLRLTHRFAATPEVTAVAGEMYAAIRRHGSPRGAEAASDALVDELLPGFRRSAA